MRTKLISGLSALAVSAMLASGAHAACDTNLSGIDEQIDDRSRAGFGTAAQDIRRLREAANLLVGYGKDEACQRVVAAIREIAQKPQYQDRERTDWRPNVTDQDVQRTQMAKAAKPVMDATGQFSTEQMVGATVYSSTTGNSVGEIDDIVLGGDQSFAIISHGGFLGMGEKRVKISLADLRVNRNDNTYYVGMSDDDFASAPAVQWQDGSWTGSAARAGGQKQEQKQEQNQKQKQ